MNVLNSIKSIISAIDTKLGAKTVNLASGVKVLCNGYTAQKGTSYTPITSNSNIPSCQRIAEIFDGANKTTGYNDATLTTSVQRLCDGYTEDTLLYSFGALSDLHIQYETGEDDFNRALSYLEGNVAFACICGDLVSYASEDNMDLYKLYAHTYKERLMLYECAGNHETYPELGVGGDLDTDLWTSATGKEPYYYVEHGDDVFIFLSLKSERPADLFVDGGLEWLRQILEANRNRRCFVFQHVQDPADDSADPSHCYSNILNGTSGAEFLKLLRHYKNTVWFHGHTHLTFGAEQYPVNEKLGYRSVHIPSLQGPRFYDETTDSLMNYYYDENGNQVWGAVLAEGYIVDVYANKIVLRGIDFTGESVDDVTPFDDEIYVLDTTLQTIEANTYG